MKETILKLASLSAFVFLMLLPAETRAQQSALEDSVGFEFMLGNCDYRLGGNTFALCVYKGNDIYGEMIDSESGFDLQPYEYYTRAFYLEPGIYTITVDCYSGQYTFCKTVQIINGGNLTVDYELGWYDHGYWEND